MTKSRNVWVPWIFVGPALLLLGIYLVYPMVQTVLYSFTEGSILRPAQEFVGFGNYVQLFTSDRFFLRLEPDSMPSGAFINSLLWVLVYPFSVVVISMIFVVLSNGMPYEKVAKSIMFIPTAISATAASVIFRSVFSPDEEIGILNAIIAGLGYEPVPWLGRADTVNIAIITAAIWIASGLAIVVLSAAYKGLPRELLEAARVDGANAWQTFWRVSLPLMFRPILFVITTNIISALKMVDLVLVMTDGGPRGASRIIGFTVYRELFPNNRVGYSSAVATVLLLMVIPFIILQLYQVRERKRS